MVYTGGSGGNKFTSCVAETQGGCGVDIGCPPGSHCAEECAPCNSVGCMDTCTPTCVADTTCAQTDCGPGYTCVEECDALVGPCQPTCVPIGDACETLGTEAACEGRSDCTPVYIGTDCTCTMTGGCTCATETYARCQAL